MAKYIELEAAISAAKEPTIYDLTDVPEWLSSLPTANVAPVVRCPMCKYCLVYKEQDGDDSYLGCTRPWGLRGALAPDDFCSYGKRRGDG